MLSSKFLKDVLDEAYPIIKRQLEDADVIASFRDLVAANGGDWSALKALMKAHVQDTLDDSGEGKRVKKILEKADSSNAYAGMLGLANMNEKNYIVGEDGIDGPEIFNLPKSAPALTVIAAAAPAVVAESMKKSEPQPTKAAGSDLATPPANDDGQVADIPETANPVSADVGEAQKVERQSPKLEDAGSIPAADAKLVAPAAIKPTAYAAKGVITWEASPPQGVIRHDYSAAFGEAGQDIAVIEDDMANACSASIVKIGNVILDGWARFMKARAIGIEYPVEQYAGSDALIDCIKLNLAGRMMTEEQKFRIAQRLAKAEPKRKADIYAAFELGMVLA